MMKNIISIVVTGIVVASMTACGPKKNANESENRAADSVAMARKADSIKMANEKIEKEKARAERKKAADARKALETYEVSGTTVYNRAEVKPEFTGGANAMKKYFKQNLKYPATAQDQGWKGDVTVDFVVGADGKVQYAEINDDTDADAEQAFKDEALRVVMAMPTWTSGSQHGKKVPASYTLPIHFEAVTE